MNDVLDGPTTRIHFLIQTHENDKKSWVHVSGTYHAQDIHFHVDEKGICWEDEKRFKDQILTKESKELQAIALFAQMLVSNKIVINHGLISDG